MDELSHLDEPPADDELPGDWEGGKLRYTGGSIWNREYFNKTRGLKAVFDPHEEAHGVGLVECDYSGEFPEFTGQVTHVVREIDGEAEEAPKEVDRQLRDVALGMLYRVEYGYIDLPGERKIPADEGKAE